MLDNELYSISVLAYGDGKEETGKVPVPVDISTETLSKNLLNFVKASGKIVESFPETYKKNYAMEEIKFSLSVDHSGKVSLIGNVPAGITAGITVTFKKRAVD
jgi:hypothetical protein